MAAGRVVAFLIGRGFAIYKSIWLFRSAPASGLIVELNPIKDQEYTTSYVLRFTFSDNRGRAYTVTCPASRIRVGEHVLVRYIRSNPSSAKLDSFWPLWLVPFVRTSLGIFFLRSRVSLAPIGTTLRLAFSESKAPDIRKGSRSP
jgi:hypothetical protein